MLSQLRKIGETLFGRTPQLPKLNYIWVGPPSIANTRERAIKDQDTHDVFLMAKICKNPITFYCLEEQIAYYKNKFSNTNISVQSIDAYLEKINKEGPSDMRDYAAQVLEIKEMLLQSPRGKIIDFVAFKDLFALFLLANDGGYTMDTNVAPKPGLTEVNFPAYPSFRFPQNERNGEPEIWMLYAPQESEEVKKVLRFYFSEKHSAARSILRATSEFNGKEYSENYHAKVTGLVPQAIALNIINEDPDWFFSLTDNHATLRGIPIQKIYGNTHKHRETYEFNLTLLGKEQPINKDEPPNDAAKKKPGPQS